MEYKDILADLNEAQNAAVTTDAPHALILAGAGSGKTKVLAQGGVVPTNGPKPGSRNSSSDLHK